MINMRIYVKADKATADHASERQWAAIDVGGIRDGLSKICQWYSCPYKYRRFRFALNHYDSKLGFSFELND
jgi:hypothetical protein